MKIRDMSHTTGVSEHECPTCKGDGKHHGPVPYRGCIRCGGFGTIILTDPKESDVQPQ